MRLAALQAEFWSAVTDDRPSHIIGVPAERLAIYTDMYRARCVECLREDFPKLAALFTPEAFRELTVAYIARHPSRDPSLASLGRELAAFLRDDPVASDLAALEWARAEVFEEADAHVLGSPSELAGPLQLIPALRRLQLHWDVAALWTALEAAAPVPHTPPGPIDVVVWRKQQTVYHTVVTREEARALECAAAGGSLDAICEAFIGAPNAVERAVRAIGSWFAEGWVADPTVRSET